MEMNVPFRACISFPFLLNERDIEFAGAARLLSIVEKSLGDTYLQIHAWEIAVMPVTRGLRRSATPQTITKKSGR